MEGRLFCVKLAPLMRILSNNSYDSTQQTISQNKSFNISLQQYIPFLHINTSSF